MPLTRFRNWIIRKFIESPSRAPVLGFLILIILGASLLMLPISSATENPISMINAVFTATSACCVTGLTTLDTATDFSTFGQLVILTLIQIGGIGIMSLSTLFILIAGGRAGFIGRLSLQDSFTHSSEYSPLNILKSITKYTFIIEGIGALALLIRFGQEFSISKAIYLSVFHSVSAFCNAGFALFSNNLMNYSNDWLVNFVIGFLIITGGLGFLVMAELQLKQKYKRRAWERLSLHSKLVLSSTAILLLTGSALFLLLEWNNTLSGLSIFDKVINSSFQSITCRTAGFNTLPIGELTNSSLFLSIILMFIGAAPGSTGGGIKVTTFSTLILMGSAALRGKDSPQTFKRTIAEQSVQKALSLVIVSLGIIALCTIILTVTELGSKPHSETDGKFIEIAFETVSAFGTAGLSTGITPNLSNSGKIAITIMMFIGRLGPLSIAFALSHKKKKLYRYAEESIMIG